MVFGDVSIASHGLTVFHINYNTYIHTYIHIYMHAYTYESVCVCT